MPSASDQSPETLRGVLSPAPKAIRRAVLVLWIADVLVGISYGAVTVALGFPKWVPIILALMVVAGASEFLFVSMVSGGASPWLASAAGLLVNTRHIPYGFVVEPLLGHGVRRLFGIHILTDESLSFGMMGQAFERRRASYWLCGIAITISWPLGTTVGTLVGSAIAAPDKLGLDAVFPAALLALVVPLITSREILVCVIGEAAVSIAAAMVLPSGLSELSSLLVVAVIYLRNRGRPAPPVQMDNKPTDGGTL